MARGISCELIPYRLEEDRELPEKEQTVFYIQPKTYKEANQTTKYYIKSFKDADSGKRDLDVDAANRADIASFKVSVKKVEQYCFPDSYYDDHPTVKEKAKKVKTHDGLELLYVAMIDSEDMIADVCRTLDIMSLREITEATNSYSKLKDGQKK